MDEQLAIQRLKHGDIEGLEFLDRRYQIQAIRMACLITRDPGLERMSCRIPSWHAYHAIRGFDTAFGPWFLRSVINASVKLMQKTASQVQIGDNADEPALLELARRVVFIVSQVVSAEARNQIWDAMQKLSPRRRAVIVRPEGWSWR